MSNDGIDGESRVDLSVSVGKLREVKSHLENMKKNKFGSFIAKKSFTLNGKKRTSIISSNLVEENNWLESHINTNPVVKKKKNDQYNFFNF
jgi:hypothetical protein